MSLGVLFPFRLPHLYRGGKTLKYTKHKVMGERQGWVDKNTARREVKAMAYCYDND